MPKLPGVVSYLRSERRRLSERDGVRPARLQLTYPDGSPVARSVSVEFRDAEGTAVHTTIRPVDDSGAVVVTVPARAGAMTISW